VVVADVIMSNILKLLMEIVPNYPTIVTNSSSDHDQFEQQQHLTTQFEQRRATTMTVGTLA
jgi:hypothetical protein